MIEDNIFWDWDAWRGIILFDSFWKDWWIVFLILLLLLRALFKSDDFDRHQWKKLFLNIWIAYRSEVEIFRMLYDLLNLWLKLYYSCWLVIIIANPCYRGSKPWFSCNILTFPTSLQKYAVVLPRTELHVECFRWSLLCYCFPSHLYIVFCRQENLEYIWCIYLFIWIGDRVAFTMFSYCFHYWCTVENPVSTRISYSLSWSINGIYFRVLIVLFGYS